MVLATALPTQKPTPDPPVGRLLPSEPPATEEVPGLDSGNLGKADNSCLSSGGMDDDAIEGAFVRIESNERGGGVRFWSGFLVEEDGAAGGQVKLLDPDPRTVKDGSVVLNELDTK